MDATELTDRLVDKSFEAFILGLEIYNKPTLKYRIEGFAFFVCNAWELMLKAKLITDTGMASIYYKDSPSRTLSLNDVIGRVYTDKKQPLRRNLETILTLRNTSTHFITEDYETVYAPLFQACVLNFDRELQRFFGRRISDHVAQNFLTLSASMAPLTDEQITIKYPPEMAAKLFFQKQDIDLSVENTKSDQFAIQIRHNLYVTRRHDQADLSVRLDKDAETPVTIVKDLKNPSATHRYSFQNLCAAVDTALKKRKVPFSYQTGTPEPRTHTTFNQHCLSLFILHFDMKSDERFAYRHVIGKQIRFTYSDQALEFIVNEIVKSPLEIITNLKRAKNSTTPGA